MARPHEPASEWHASLSAALTLTTTSSSAEHSAKGAGAFDMACQFSRRPPVTARIMSRPDPAPSPGAQQEPQMLEGIGRAACAGRQAFPILSTFPALCSTPVQVTPAWVVFLLPVILAGRRQHQTSVYSYPRGKDLRIREIVLTWNSARLREHMMVTAECMQHSHMRDFVFEQALRQSPGMLHGPLPI